MRSFISNTPLVAPIFKRKRGMNSLLNYKISTFIVQHEHRNEKRTNNDNDNDKTWSVEIFQITNI